MNILDANWEDGELLSRIHLSYVNVYDRLRMVNDIKKSNEIIRDAYDCSVYTADGLAIACTNSEKVDVLDAEYAIIASPKKYRCLFERDTVE